MHALLQDLRYASRMLVRAPGFTAVVVLTLALGIGANTAIFSVVYALLLRPLPYREPDRIVMVWQDMTARGGPAREWTTPGNFADLAGEPAIFEAVTAVRGWQPTITGLGDPEPLLGEQVSREYFAVLGVEPSRGRTFTVEDDAPGAAPVAILSHGLWLRRFGGDPAVLGRQVMLGGEPHEIVGVMPEAFRPAVTAAAEIWRPGRLNRASPARGMVILHMLARLGPGVDLKQARAAAQSISQRLQQAYETTTWYRLVSADYLKAMSIPIRRGRVFAPREAAPSVVVNETAARRFWRGEDAIGRRVHLGGGNTPWFTVVGIAGDVSNRGARREARVEMYVPYWHFAEPGMNVVLKSVGAPESLESMTAGLRAAVKAIDPDMPVSNVAPMTRLVEASIAQPRFLALLVAIFAALAMALSAIGIYGVMSYAVAQRTAEIGVRMALGADRQAVFALVAREGLLLAASGIVIGLAGAFLIGRGLSTLLYAVAPGDPATYAATAAAVLVVALAAIVLPARRATRVDPLTALRAE